MNKYLIIKIYISNHLIYLLQEIILNYTPQNDDIDITNDKTNDALNSLILNQSKMINPSNFAKVSLPTKENEIINHLNVTKLNQYQI